jgi:hypothetical protein
MISFLVRASCIILQHSQPPVKPLQARPQNRRPVVRDSLLLCIGVTGATGRATLDVSGGKQAPVTPPSHMSSIRVELTTPLEDQGGPSRGMNVGVVQMRGNARAGSRGQRIGEFVKPYRPPDLTGGADCGLLVVCYRQYRGRRRQTGHTTGTNNTHNP